ncbi:MAG: helix-turn-helix transcriptional regulator [Actinomycetota bacterium]|nr:helix-turn-helix transcriptional regulator [Actinomycetota bacterium]
MSWRLVPTSQRLFSVCRMPATRAPASLARGSSVEFKISIIWHLLRRARGESSMLNTALDAGVSPETLRKIESGRVATPAFPTIAAVADVLGISLDALWAEINQSGGGVEPARSDRNAGERLVS